MLPVPCVTHLVNRVYDGPLYHERAIKVELVDSRIHSENKAAVRRPPVKKAEEHEGDRRLVAHGQRHERWPAYRSARP